MTNTNAPERIWARIPDAAAGTAMSAPERVAACGHWEDSRSIQVDAEGSVFANGHRLSQHISTKGYPKVTIGGKAVFVHRVVAQAFLPNLEGKPEVNHIDGDKKNNAANNLEWCTRSENMKHAYATGLHPGVSQSGEDSPNWRRNGKRHPQSMAVRGIHPDGTVIDYDSQGLAAFDGFSPPKISMCIAGKNKTHKGFIWMPLLTPPESTQ